MASRAKESPRPCALFLLLGPGPSSPRVRPKMHSTACPCDSRPLTRPLRTKASSTSLSSYSVPRVTGLLHVLLEASRFMQTQRSGTRGREPPVVDGCSEWGQRPRGYRRLQANLEQRGCAIGCDAGIQRRALWRLCAPALCSPALDMRWTARTEFNFQTMARVLRTSTGTMNMAYGVRGSRSGIGRHWEALGGRDRGSQSTEVG